MLSPKVGTMNGTESIRGGLEKSLGAHGLRTLRGAKERLWFDGERGKKGTGGKGKKNRAAHIVAPFRMLISQQNKKKKKGEEKEKRRKGDRGEQQQGQNDSSAATEGFWRQNPTTLTSKKKKRGARGGKKKGKIKMEQPRGNLTQKESSHLKSKQHDDEPSKEEGARDDP